MTTKIWYVVLKLSTDVTYTNPFTGKEVTEKIQGIAGYIPCYETYEEAVEASMDGKYEITQIKQNENDKV